MNFKTLPFVSAIAIAAFGQATQPLQSPYSGFSRIMPVPATTQFVYVDDNVPQSYYGSANYQRTISGMATSLQHKRSYVLISSKLNQYVSGKTGDDFQVAGGAYQEQIVAAPLQLEGHYLTVLAPYPLDKQNGLSIPGGIVNTSSFEDEPIFVKICSDLEDTTLAAFRACRISISGFTRTMISTFAGKYAAAVYEAAWTNALKAAGFPFTEYLFVKDESGNVRAAVITKYGYRYQAYAMYGVWHDETKAREFGFHAGMKIYFSEAEMTPPKGGPLAGVLIDKMRFGVQCFSEQEISANKDALLPKLAWRKCQVWGDMEVRFDANGVPGQFSCMGEKLEIPNNPDNANNTNPPSLMGYPDADWYFGLFQKKYEQEMSTDKPSVPSSNFLDYETYMARKMSDSYDPTQYHTDGSISPQEISHENPPAGSKIYDAECKLLSGQSITIKDPLGPNTTFKMIYWATSITDWFAGDKECDVTSRVKAAINTVAALFPLIESNPKQAKESGFNVDISNSDFSDSNWYFGNKANRYEPFNDKTEFIVFNDHYQDNSKFLYVISRDTKGGISDWFAGASNKQDSKWIYKKFWIQFVWPLVYRDKFGILRYVGKATYEAEFLTENDDMHNVYGGNGDGKNTWIKIATTDEDVVQFDEYNKQSKDYKTDQEDVYDRANGSPDDMEKKQIREMITMIAVAEFTDFLMKQVHNLGQNDNPYVKSAGIAAYEAGKRIENNMAVKTTYSIVKSSFEMYLMWRETMDLCAKMRDTYNEIGAAWEGLKKASGNIYAYYKNLDLRTIRLTNITKLFPTSNLYYMDYSLQRMQISMRDFSAACNEMSLNADSFVIAPVVKIVDAKLREAVHDNARATSEIIDRSIENLESCKAATDRTPARQQYLSLVTSSICTALGNTHLKILTDGTLGIALALKIISDEANDWQELSRYARTTYSKEGFDDFSKDESNQEKFTFYPIIRHFRAPRFLFENRDISKIDDPWSLNPEKWDFVSINKARLGK